MASRLPALTGKELIRALRKAGFVESRQRGSHVMLVGPCRGTKTVVPALLISSIFVIWALFVASAISGTAEKASYSCHRWKHAEPTHFR